MATITGSHCNSKSIPLPDCRRLSIMYWERTEMYWVCAGLIANVNTRSKCRYMIHVWTVHMTVSLARSSSIILVFILSVRNQCKAQENSRVDRSHHQMPRASRHIQRRMVLATQIPSEKWWLHFIALATIGLWMLVVTLGSNLPFHSDRKFSTRLFLVTVTILGSDRSLQRLRSWFLTNSWDLGSTESEAWEMCRMIRMMAQELPNAWQAL